MPPVRVSRETLSASLSLVSAGLSTRNFVEQSSCFVFEHGWVYTYNEEVCCRAKLPPGLEVLTGAVRAEPLVAALDAVSDDDVTLNPKPGRLDLAAGAAKVWVRMESEILLPARDVGLPDVWAPVDAQRFKSAVLTAAATAGTNDEEFVTVCVHLHPEFVEASDRKQVYRCTIDTGVPESFLVRAASLAKCVDIGPTNIGVTDEWVHFRTNTSGRGLYVSARRHVEDYPDLTPSLEFRGTPARLPESGVAASKLGGVFTASDKENNKLLVRVSAGTMVVVGEGAFGGAEIHLPMTYDGPPVSFRIPPATLARVIKEYNACEIGANKLRASGEDWVYMTVLGKADPVPVAADPPPGDEEEADDDGPDGYAAD
jgi:hypothetical protein